VESGIRYFYEQLTFRGLTVIDMDHARSFFVRTHGLLKTRALLRFSHSEFKQALGNLENELKSLGYADAEVTAANLDLNDRTGEVRAIVQVEQGALHRIREVNVTVRESADGSVVRESTMRGEGRIFSRLIMDDIEQELLVDWFHEGYPDATATLREESQTTTEAGIILVDLRAEVTRGPRIKLGEIRFEGPIRPRRVAALERRVDLEGPWLDRLDVDDARARLARLGGFRFINVKYEAATNETAVRDAVFEVEPGRRLSVDLLAGFRSYELLYGGVDVVRRNLFGLGHSAELKLVQSFKSSEGYVSYSIPDAFAKDVTIFALAEALRREEVSFRREEFRTSIGVRRVFEGTGHQIGIRYNYELLRAVGAPTTTSGPAASDRQPDVASLTLDWSLDRRDSPVAPRSGYHVAAALEFAQPEFGGEARFLRPDIDASAHLPLGGGRYLHAGIRYLLVDDPGRDNLVPFNKRIFSGGEDSVRGYQRGEAAPRNAAGEEIGAESALVWNLEFEQLLTPSWSVVAFADGVAQTADIAEFPWDEVLWSVGAGLRWNTAIGPVRFEYGYNLNRRVADPAGTFHFSVGFPF
jgi:outer membrane protein assembly factor BamA